MFLSQNPPYHGNSGSLVSHALLYEKITLRELLRPPPASPASPECSFRVAILRISTLSGGVAIQHKYQRNPTHLDIPYSQKKELENFLSILFKQLQNGIHSDPIEWA